MAGDLLAPGRLAFGESLAFTSLQTSTRLCIGGRLVLADRAALRPDWSTLARAGLFEGYTHLGTLYLAGAVGAAADVDALAEQLAAWPQVLAGVSRPHPQVVVARVLGHGAEVVARVLGTLAPGLVGG